MDGAEAMCFVFVGLPLPPSIRSSALLRDMQAACCKTCVVEDVGAGGCQKSTKVHDGLATGTKPVSVWHGDTVQAFPARLPRLAATLRECGRKERIAGQQQRVSPSKEKAAARLNLAVHD
jgi:hypothetical protein